MSRGPGHDAWMRCWGNICLIDQLLVAIDSLWAHLLEVVRHHVKGVWEAGAFVHFATLINQRLR